jgi:hypothetical protein
VACICAGLRSRRRHIEDPQAAQPSERDLDDSRPDPHDNELYDILDMEAMDEAGADFLRRFEKEEQGGYHRLHVALRL